VKLLRKYHQLLIYFSAVISLQICRIRVYLVLAWRFLPDLVVIRVNRLRSDFPVRRAVLIGLVFLAIVVPTQLYVGERARRINLDMSYRQLDFVATAEISTLNGSLRKMAEEQQELRSLLMDKGVTVVSGDVFSTRLVATGYSSSVMETDDTPFITASNTRTRPGVVAMSRDLLRRYNPQAPFSFGDTIHITGLGDFFVEDSMHWRWRRRIDIWFPSRDAAWRFGKRNVTVSKLLDEDSEHIPPSDFTRAVGESSGRLASKMAESP
jgi:3D (Asp-Asp-Asp) domain-containing protein